MGSRALGIGFIGYGWMGRTHAHALATVQRLAPVSRPIRLVAVCGRNRARVTDAAVRLGFDKATSDWRAVVHDPDVDVVANLAPTDAHLEPCIAALSVGKAVLCEKPLAGDAREAMAMRAAAESSRVPAVCGFNYRFVPAMRLAREEISSGRLGAIRHLRAAYLQDWAASTEVPHSWRFTAAARGNGAVGDYSHIVDLCHYLAGEAASLVARTHRFVDARPDPDEPARTLPVGSEDWYGALLRLESGAMATLEASRCATGWKARQVVEIWGTDGALWWNLEDLNRLHVFVAEDEAERLGGFRDVLVTEREHPFMDMWWAPGHIIGWEHTFVHQWHAFLTSVVEGTALSPHQATFGDGYRAAVVCEAILDSAETHSSVDVGDVALRTEANPTSTGTTPNPREGG